MNFNVEIVLTTEMATELQSMSAEVKREVYERVMCEIQELVSTDIGDEDTAIIVTYSEDELN